MKPKIVVADDSLTIQKVIKITLANEDFELVECLDESKLQDLISEHQPTLVLLDFNLSENKTGYDLSKEIRAAGVPKVFVLYGTFDTIDEKLLEHAGASAHIVKPFEGTRFIQQCRQLIEDVELEAEEKPEFPDPIVEAEPLEEPTPEIDEDDQWVVNQPEMEELPPVQEEIEDEYVSDEILSADKMNELDSQIADWGIDVPGVIGEPSEKKYVTADFPPVIEEMEEEKSPDNFVENDPPVAEDDIVETPIKEAVEIEMPPVSEMEEPVIETVKDVAQDTTEEALPPSEDLEYPDVDMIKSSVEAEVIEPKSQLISVADLAEENRDEEWEDDSEGTKTEEEVRNLEAQIADEVEEDLWSVDEVVGDDSEEAEVESNPVEESHEDHSHAAAVESMSEGSQEDNTLEKDFHTREEILDSDRTGEFEISGLQPAHIENLDEQKILEMVEPLVEKIVQKRVEEILEKVAWEVIPDLSENLIKQELQSISEKILASKK